MEKDVFFGRANESSDVGRMIANGHHRQVLHYGESYQLPADRHCDSCGATCGSAEALQICPFAEMVHVEVMRAQQSAVLGEYSTKKITRGFRRSIEKATKFAVDQRLKELDRLVKEKPRYCPQWTWDLIKGMVLRDRVEV